jgi:dienelactone hydrolase
MDVDRSQLQGAQVGTIYPLLQRLADESPLELSFLQDRFQNLEVWKDQARAKVLELLRYNPATCDPATKVLERTDCGDFIREKIEFNTTPDLRVPAYLLLPKGRTGQRPGIVALHDHGGFFVWGKEKIVATENEHPTLTEFKRSAYSGRSWASDLAARGYVVLAIDMFYWGERRLILAEDPDVWWTRDQMSADDVQKFNVRSNEFTSRMAIGLFTAGVTWAGMMFTDDLRSVDYLATRPEVDPDRIGCCGLSVGGYRCDYLAGLHRRIKAAIVIGWMDTFGTMLRDKLTSIGFMKVVPGLYQYLDLPDIVSMTCPGGLRIIQGLQDTLFTNAGVQQAYDKIAGVYKKAGVPERFAPVTYDGPHEFNAQQQDAAFAWLDGYLRP